MGTEAPFNTPKVYTSRRLQTPLRLTPMTAGREDAPGRDLPVGGDEGRAPDHGLIKSLQAEMWKYATGESETQSIGGRKESDAATRLDFAGSTAPHLDSRPRCTVLGRVLHYVCVQLLYIPPVDPSPRDLLRLLAYGAAESHIRVFVANWWRLPMAIENAEAFSIPTAGDPVLAEMVRRLVEVYKPERIILFGSVARDEAGPDSDYDLMVVVPDDATPERQRYRAVRHLGAARDIFVSRTSDFRRQLHLKASFPSTVVREGIVLYGA